ncbi:MAG: sulfotransferase domain-containing protein [Pseudomonadota bacterium]
MTDDKITIVSGLPRSGTSLMMQVVVAGGIPALTDNIRKADDDNPKGYWELEAVKKVKEDASFLKGAPGKVFKAVHLLLYDLPPDFGYRVVFTERRIEEVLASQKKMLDRMGKDHGGLTDGKLGSIFGDQIEKLKTWLAGRENFSVLYVDYNEVVEDPKPTVEKINAFLGGGLDTSAMLAVVDPTLYRPRK